MTIQEKAESVVDQAKTWAADAGSWMDFSNRLFADDGLVARTFPRMTERQAFYGLPQYEELNQLLLSLIKAYGIGDGKIKKKSGKFVVRIPKTLHTALDMEAQQEGVSLNQLALTKLSIRLDESTDMAKSLIVQAFRNVYDGFSTDRIVVDDEYNIRFLTECRKLGLPQSDYELNHLLQDIRKSGKAALPPATKKPRITDYDDFAFASEIAFRYLQMKEGVSLDRVMCDPELRKHFDEIARRLAPSQSDFKLRMGALYLRKTHRLSPKNVKSKLSVDELLGAGRVGQFSLDDVPEFPGMYAFYRDVRPMFAGETSQLRHRMQLHIEPSGNLFLPNWLELGHEGDLELRLVAVPKISHKERLAWLNKFINHEKPPFNYQAA